MSHEKIVNGYEVFNKRINIEINENTIKEKRDL